MPFFTSDNAKIYYEDIGKGDPIIAVAGLMENTAYWRLTGVTGRLAEEYRFIAMDMRGHGYTVVAGEPQGFDENAVAKDIIALADYLGLDKFHVLTHSTGGFVAVRYAMVDCSRYASLILTNTASFTTPIQGDRQINENFHEGFARWFEKYDWEEMFDWLRQKSGPFFRGIMESHSHEGMLEIALAMAKRNDRFAIARFIRSFYKDPDPRVEELRGIACPALIIYGEKDDLFIESSRLMAREIPGAELLEYKNIGHMTAIEAPDRLTEDIRTFLHKKTFNK